MMTTRKMVLVSKPSSYVAGTTSSIGSMSPSSSTTSSSGELDEFLVRRGKKRRLDHLTWEEKVQRKKLKNRVAAQTSRDRKKQKMDEMEVTLNQVTEENEQLRIDFNNLETSNVKLRLQNGDLQKQVERLQAQVKEQAELLAERDQQLEKLLVNGVAIKEEQAEIKSHFSSEETKESIADIALKIGSAEGFVGEPDEDVLLGLASDCALPALQDLLEASSESNGQGSDGDVEQQPGSPVFDLRSWEELAETLLADISRQMANDASGSGEPIAPHAGTVPPLSGQLVGTRSEGMEPARKSRSVTHDHAYLSDASSRDDEEEEEVEMNNSSRSTTNNKNQMNHSDPDLELRSCVDKMPEPISIDSHREEGVVTDSQQKDMVFGSYDEAANCITIFVADDAKTDIQQPDATIPTVENVKGSTTMDTEFNSWDLKSMAAPLQPCLSPLSSLSLMESGYEGSLGSPESDIWSTKGTNLGAAPEGLDELWNDSFSELFPSLV